jgi:hypothetical protein
MIQYSAALPYRYEFDDRVFADDGAVYDLGCYRWEWNGPFVGRKTFIGVDPNESSCPVGCKLVQAAVTPYGGTVTMRGGGLNAQCCDPSIPYVPPIGYPPGSPETRSGDIYEVPAITWGQLIAEYGPAAMVKINIEGAEIPLLFSVKQPMAPQIVVAFHPPDVDTVQCSWPPPEAIDACLAYLAQWYNIQRGQLAHSGPDNWWIMTVKD